MLAICNFGFFINLYCLEKEICIFIILLDDFQLVFTDSVYKSQRPWECPSPLRNPHFPVDWGLLVEEHIFTTFLCFQLVSD